MSSDIPHQIDLIKDQFIQIQSKINILNIKKKKVEMEQLAVKNLDRNKIVYTQSCRMFVSITVGNLLDKMNNELNQLNNDIEKIKDIEEKFQIRLKDLEDKKIKS